MQASFAGRCTLKSAAFATPTSGRRRRNVLKHAARAEAGDSPPKAAAAAADSTDLAQSELPATQVAQVEQVLPQRKAPDYYRNAGHRLRTLLNGVGDGEEELINSMLEEQPAEHKLALVLLAAGLVSGAAAAVCWLCGIDPAGGASLSTDTLRAAAVGGAAAAPLVAFKASLWSEPARRQLPFLDDIHKAQADAFKPVMANLNGPQTVVLLASGG